MMSHPNTLVSNASPAFLLLLFVIAKWLPLLFFASWVALLDFLADVYFIGCLFLNVCTFPLHTVYLKMPLVGISNF